ncbi:RNA-binding protein 5-A-like isoform X2 [Drosophila tropicalis]|uniref:RNA-binding protein 5-A-like isoform X2 n=1 Tax=Drosophila tropicalis TaxID=46794 RepID=UPI0035AB8581
MSSKGNRISVSENDATTSCFFIWPLRLLSRPGFGIVYVNFFTKTSKMDFRYGRSYSGSSSNNSQYRRYSRSRSRSRERNRRRHSRSPLHFRHDVGSDQDLYRDLNDDDYKREGSYNSRNHYEHRQHRRDDNYNRRDDNSNRREDNSNRREDIHENERDSRFKNYDRQARERNMDNDRCNDRSSGENTMNNNKFDRREDRNDRKVQNHNADRENERGYQQNRKRRFSEEATSNTIVIFDLSPDCTKELLSDRIRQVNLEPIHISRKKIAGSSREIAFIDFSLLEEAKQWMDINQGRFQVGEHRYIMDYGHKRNTDWRCIKCGGNNFKSRINCYMCKAPRIESENGANDGLDEVTYIISKKIMLRNLDALTNEEGVLTALQHAIPDLAKTVSKLEISRDKLTQTSRGICYLHFETLIESMNVHNGLTALDPPLTIDEKAVTINYCMEPEDRPVVSKDNRSNFRSQMGVPTSVNGGTHTLADVPQLAEYSASLYASNPEEKVQYLQYYTDYYTAEITKGIRLGSQLTEANSGAAVALEAIQRKQQKTLGAPKGNDGKTYPPPNIACYQYDETSGYYYDPSTGLYYDAHSQYYYNNETGAYLYWDQSRSTYLLAAPNATGTGQVPTQPEAKEETSKSEKEANGKPDKVKVAKMIVKDMEKWAKHLNQKKDYTVVATPQPILSGSSAKVEVPSTSRVMASQSSNSSIAYADVGFSIMEKKERVPSSSFTAINKLVNNYGNGSESEEDQGAVSQSASVDANDKASGGSDEKDLVDFEKLTCLLCKRAFLSLETLQKHLKLSNLHKDNLAKIKQNSEAEDGSNGGQSYRDRAKERRLKYGESDPPPSNRNREIFQREMTNLQNKRKEKEAEPETAIASSNVGSRLLQKMGWSEGQGLGRKNQGRTHIVEASDRRSENLGLGNKVSGLRRDDDYNTYVKRMMKQRYKNA